jgi:2-iminobutanoate/2-iminopropanoate deaminase
MNHIVHDIGVAKNIGRYNDAIEAGPGLRWLYTSGTPGMTASGELPPDIKSQTRIAWENILEILKRAGMTVHDLVKVTTTLTSAENIPAYVEMRSEVLGDVRPAFMIQVIDRLVRPDILVEIEIVAASR